MTEKILARAAGRDEVTPGEIVVCEVDRAVLLDTQFASTAVPWRMPTVVPHPERVTVVLDHAVPAPTPRDASGQRLAREFCSRFGIDIADVGHGGISHQVIAERGLARPGELLLCSDSHTCAAGAFNTAARGVGGLEMLQVLCTGSAWFAVQPTISVELTGMLRPECEGKDAFLALAAKYGSAENMNLEFAGDGVKALSLHDRRIIATQGAEVNAEFVLFPVDDVVARYLSSRVSAPPAPAEADEAATYAEHWMLDLDGVTPQVARPDGIVGNITGASLLGDVRLDQCFIGSCTNGHLEDFATAAEVLKGGRIAPHTRLVVTPSSQRVYRDAVRAGYVETIVEAGGIVTSSTCGACFGYHMGVLGDGEVCLTASTRNFKGRMGSPTSEVYLASTRTVAASALVGRITDPREI